MRKLYAFLLLFCLSVSVLANRTEVTTASEITTGSWLPGDTIVMKNGTWTDQNIALTGNGTEEQAIVLMAETPGEVILTGNSRIAFSGSYIIIEGLYFKNGDLSGLPVISFRTSSSKLANNCRLSNTTIENYNPPDKTTDSKWVSMYGENNRVDHCTFVNKTNSGTLLVVWLKAGLTPNHIIDHNFFGYRNANLDSNGNELNGQEIIRIGDSSTSMQDARVLVSDNYFEHCNGEIEIISNKSCENIYRNNIFFECVGMLTLRHGNRCTVEGNYFFGNGISNSGGVRVIGEDHKVYNNYFENLQGTGYRAALCLVRGIENSELNEYFQVKNALVVHNTMVDCKQSFSINYGSSSEQKMPPIGSLIANNHVYNTSDSWNNVTIYQTSIADLDVSWQNNLMNQGGYTSFPYADTQIIAGIDPSMELAGTSIEIYEPAESSLLINYASNDIPEVTQDIRGRDRANLKIPGASQLTGSVSIEMPTKLTAGSDYYVPTANNLSRQIKEIDFIAYTAHNNLYTKVSEPGTLSVFDIAGRRLYQVDLNEGLHSNSLTGSGIFILRYHTLNGEVIAKKIASTL